MIKLILLSLLLTLSACGGAPPTSPCDTTTGEAGAPATEPCNQEAALAAFRAARHEEGQVGEWVISPDCVVTQVAQ